MNITKLKIVALAFGVIAVAVISMFLTAGFAVERPQSWPKALWEIRPVLFLGIGGGIGLGLAGKLWQKRFVWVSVVVYAGSFGGLCWAIASNPPSDDVFRYFGLAMLITFEISLVSGLSTTVRGVLKKSKRPLPLSSANLSLN